MTTPDNSETSAGQIEVLSVQLGELLSRHGLRVSAAESCTGGLITAAITEVPGSSAWFEQGWVTYSYTAKQLALGVSIDVLQASGAVSEGTVLAMADGALQRSNADIAVAVSGIAGPDGGSVEKPVGTVCLGWAVKGKESTAQRFRYTGNRRAVRLAAVADALRGTISRVEQSLIP